MVTSGSLGRPEGPLPRGDPPPFPCSSNFQLLGLGLIVGALVGLLGMFLGFEGPCTLAGDVVSGAAISRNKRMTHAWAPKVGIIFT